MNPADVSGLELSRRFYHEAVGPVLQTGWPDLPYSAALLGKGSEVLGFDDRMSRDHDWGPRLILFLSDRDRREQGEALRDELARRLPVTFLGYPTHFTEPDPDGDGTRRMHPGVGGPVRHGVEITDLETYLDGYLGIRSVQGIGAADWLTLPEQKLLSLTAGEVFHDGLADPADGEPRAGRGVLARMRSRLDYYPRDVWLFQLAAAWARIGQEEHLVGRAGHVGDEVGAALIAARLVRDLMRLCFLMERTYAPYPKWLGAAFRRLQCGPALDPVLREVLAARDWESRESHLVVAYQSVAAMHNELGITNPLSDRVARFFERPFRVMAFHGFSDALLGRVDAGFLTDALRRSPIGGVDLVSDSPGVLEEPGFRPALRRLYGSR